MGKDHVFITRRRRVPGQRREHELILEEGTDDEDCRQLVDLENVMAVRINSPNITDIGFALLCQHKSIEDLRIGSDAQLSSDAASSIAKLRLLKAYGSIGWYRGGVTSALCTIPALETCEIHDDSLSDEQIERMGTCESLLGLSVDGNSLSGVGFRGFGALCRLRRLSVGRNRLEQQGLECIASIKSVESLAMAGLGLEGLSLACLARMDLLTQLHLEHSILCNSHIRDLRACTQLSCLWMSYEQLQVVDMREIAQLGNLKRLLVCGEAPEELLQSMRAAFRKGGVDCSVEP